METIQKEIGALQTSVKRQRFAIVALAGIIVAGGFIAAVRPVGDATFDIITCKRWQVVDTDEMVRIKAEINGNGAGVQWLDKDGKARIAVVTSPNGNASVGWLDKDEKGRITAGTTFYGSATLGLIDKDGKSRISAVSAADGVAAIGWLDKDEKVRFQASTLPDGTIHLPTKDENPPKP